MNDFFPTLKDLSLNVFCESLKEHARNSDCVLALRNFVYLPEKITEQLINVLSLKGLLNSQTLSLFNHENIRMKHLRIPDASLILNTDLQFLRRLKLKEVQVNYLEASVEELIASFHEWTRGNLEKLNVSHTTLSTVSRRKYSLIYTSVSALKNLRELDVSHTDINVPNLDIIVEDLPKLDSLNISYTRINDISPLLKCKTRLKTLIMANVELSQKFATRGKSGESEPDNVLFHLTKLRHLDVSFEKDTNPFNIITGPESWRYFEISSFIDKLPDLISLDISGNEFIDEESLIAFLQSHLHLKFLGLVNTEVCECNVFSNPQNPNYRHNLKIAGTANFEQVVLSLKLYEKRTSFMQNALYSLYSLSNRTELGSRPDLIKLLTNVMRVHANVFHIQLACSACLYNVTKNVWSDNDSYGLPSTLMSEVAQLTLDAMQRFPTHSQLQRNALLTLCNDRILQNTNIDRFRCAKLVLNALCTFDIESIERLCVAISSIIAAKISSEQMSEIGSHKRYMKKLLSMVKRKLDILADDSTLGFTLSTLWNITDESLCTCTTFLREDGLELFSVMLQEYAGCDSVLTKILGLLNNIAEFPELRHHLMKDDLIDSVRNLLDSDSIEIAYFSAGILAHLVSAGTRAWAVDKISREVILKELGEAVLRWVHADGEMVAYRSFRPFLPLLNCYETYQAQLWALWAMQHVLTINAARYSQMLEKENVCDVFSQMIQRRDTNPFVKKQAQIILSQLFDYKQNMKSVFKF